MKPQYQQETTPVSAHLKLLKQQVQEWKAMMATQGQVRALVQERLNAQRSTPADLPFDRIQQTTQQAHHLYQLRQRQLKERNQLKLRHQQEEAQLLQVLKEQQM